MNKRLMWAVLSLLMTLAGCQQPQTTTSIVRDDKGVVIAPQWKKYDVQPQVIYRIDDHRFVTLESYNHCSGETWYNDTRTGVRTMVGHTWPNGFLGKLIIDDPTGMNVVIPKFSTNSCGDRGCMNYLAYSTDGGRSFSWLQYDIHKVSFDSSESSKRYAIYVTQDSLYITLDSSKQADSLTDRYPLKPGYVYGPNANLPKGVGIKFNTELPPKLHTPSGQDGFICDASIQPSNAD